MRQPEHIQQKTSKNLKGKVDISREEEWRKKKKNIVAAKKATAFTSFAKFFSRVT